jgi:hypothetical protein
MISMNTARHGDEVDYFVASIEKMITLVFLSPGRGATDVVVDEDAGLGAAFGATWLPERKVAALNYEVFALDEWPPLSSSARNRSFRAAHRKGELE